MNLKGRDLLTVLDYTEEELRYVLDTAKKLKMMIMQKRILTFTTSTSQKEKFQL